MHADTIVAQGLHLGSHHFQARDFNNVTPGAYVRWGSGLTLGHYFNSERRPSLYAGQTFEHGPFAVTVGAITGYRRAYVLPLVVPSVRIGRVGDVSFRLAYLPKVGRDGSHVLHLMAEF